MNSVDKPRGMSYNLIARRLGLSVEEVQAIEAAALRKCRAWCKEQGLDLADLLEPDDEPYSQTVQAIYGAGRVRPARLDCADEDPDDGAE